VRRALPCSFTFAWLVVLAVALFAGSAGCKGKPPPAADDPASATSAPVVKDSTEGLLFTWIDEKGEFHIQEKPIDVPLVGRDAVRVVDPTNYDADHPDKIWLADLRLASADGTYTVKASTRAEFDAMAEARRAKNGTTLANAQKPAEPPGPGGSGDGISIPGLPGMAGLEAGAPRPTVILYGASWCGACHEAAAYFKRKGIAFVEKDIEEDANAAREMQAKLARAGKRSGSIPVLDVRGKIMVGFDAQEVDSALGQAL
jgi:glutaredoxin